uniref:Uncharacterized protein n=1 Tax=Myoviridae sp. cteo515 TaxID=2823550 RepID=A0A8S5LBA7_9CAUD|nr:MAG TPA: hypothetical protein [Myoviridae sp. cteo515]
MVTSISSTYLFLASFKMIQDFLSRLKRLRNLKKK